MKIKFKKNTAPEKTKYITLSNSKKKYEIVCDLQKSITVDNKKLDIEIITEDNDFTYIAYKNKKYPVEIIERNQNRYHILINGVSYFFSIETPISYARKKFLDKNKKKAKSEVIKAPMPGTIVEVLVDEGTEVNEGEALVILEAMKMQNEILSTTSGTVTKIHIKPTDNINKDDLMIEIKK